VENMREQTVLISERDLLYAIGGQLFEQAPNREPRNAQKIMMQVRDAFRKEAYNDNEYYSLRIAEEKLYKYIESLLMGIKEFVELNLSQNEVDNGVNIDDESRPKYTFTDRYSKIPWKSDFIDLDAFIRNVVNRFWIIKYAEMSCFGCINKDTDKCSWCAINNKLRVNYKGNREPRGKYTLVCKFDCYKSRYICCEECDDKNVCAKKCDGNYKGCSNVVK